MSLISPYFLLLPLLTWIGLTFLVWWDSVHRAGANDTRWFLIVLLTGVLGFAAYILFVVSPPKD